MNAISRGKKSRLQSIKFAQNFTTYIMLGMTRSYEKIHCQHRVHRLDKQFNQSTTPTWRMDVDLCYEQMNRALICYISNKVDRLKICANLVALDFHQITLYIEHKRCADDNSTTQVQGWTLRCVNFMEEGRQLAHMGALIILNHLMWYESIYFPFQSTQFRQSSRLP